jgi:hypothetical protein
MHMAAAAEVSTRAGRYVSQPTGYRAFIPATLTRTIQRALS